MREPSCLEAGRDVRLRQHLAHAGVQPGDDVGGRSARHEHPVPLVGFVALDAALGHRGHVRERRVPVGRRDRERPDGAALHVTGDRRQVRESQIDLAADDGQDRRAAALVRHVQHLDARALGEQRRAHVLDGTLPRPSRR